MHTHKQAIKYVVIGIHIQRAVLLDNVGFNGKADLNVGILIAQTQNFFLNLQQAFLVNTIEAMTVGMLGDTNGF